MTIIVNNEQLKNTFTKMTKWNSHDIITFVLTIFMQIKVETYCLLG
jgi:hypothetical protein